MNNLRPSQIVPESNYLNSPVPTTEQQQLKDKLESLKDQLLDNNSHITSLEDSIRLLCSRLYKLRSVGESLQQEYMATDRKLAMIDGRYKVVVATKKAEKSEISKLSKDEILQVIEALNSLVKKGK